MFMTIVESGDIKKLPAKFVVPVVGLSVYFGVATILAASSDPAAAVVVFAFGVLIIGTADCMMWRELTRGKTQTVLATRLADWRDRCVALLESDAARHGAAIVRKVIDRTPSVIGTLVAKARTLASQAATGVRAHGRGSAPSPANGSETSPTVMATIAIVEDSEGYSHRTRDRVDVDAEPIVADPLEGDTKSAADDLKAIVGIGPVLEGRLFALGIRRIDEIAAWSDEDVRRVSADLGFSGRIERQDWVGQARSLVAEAHASRAA